jgi:hypothetical protein
MTASVIPAPALDARLANVWRVDVSVSEINAKPDKPQGPAAQTAEKILEEDQQQRQADLDPGVLQILVDADAGRFVNVLLDPHSQEVLRRYPSEGQLAYARAVNKYLRALK